MSESIWNDPRITAYVLDELPADERAAFESEMQSNPELAAAVEEARGVTSKLDSLFASESTPPLDANRRDKIIAGENHQTFVTTKPNRAWYQLGTVELVVTAAIVLIICAIAIPASMSPKIAMNGDAVVDPHEEPTLSEEDYMRMATSGQEQDEEIVERSADSLGGERELTPHDLADASGFAAAEAAAPTTSPMAAAPMAAAAMSADSASDQVHSRAEAKRDAGAAPPQVAMRSMLKESAPDQRPDGADQRPDGAGQAGASRALSMSQSPSESLQIQSGSRTASESKPEVMEKSRRSMMTRRSDAAKEAKDSESAKKSEASELHAMAPDAPAAPAGPFSESPEPFGDFFGGAEIAESDAQMGMPGSGMAMGGLQNESNENLRRGRSSGREMESMDMGMSMPASPSADRFESKPTNRGGESTAGGYGLPMNTVPSNTSLRTELKQSIPGLPKAIQLLDEEVRNPEGAGPGTPGDQFDVIEDNPFRHVSEHPLSTFSVDVDTASYSKVRDFLVRANQLPRPDAVRIEEMINYFDYNYDPPAADAEHPFAARAVVTECPWNPQHRLARIALKGKVIEQSERPRCNLVFLLDTSGSMNQANKLPLVQDGMKMLLEQLNENDRVAIAVYAGSAGLVLDSTKVKNGKKVRKALTQLSAGGSTNGGAGIALAYQVARDHFIPDGVNRVILCTDGDFNVGTTGTDALVRMVEKEAKGGVFLSVLGFGMGNHNDSMLEQISGRGNGNYAFIDNEKEARKVLVDQTNSTLVTIAKDVKLQVEFNPTQVNSYRLIGYENRVLAKEDFNDDQKDAGEIGAGHSVTALYEIVPAGSEPDAAKPKVDDLKYQAKVKPTKAAQNDEMLTIKLRYKQPDGDTSTLVEFPVTDEGDSFDKADKETRFAAAVAGFGMQLRRSEYKGNWTLGDVIRVAEASKGEDRFELRAEFIQLAQKASQLMGQE
ncbi:von Willebrand factor type A domain-containing protein [Novipirellula sp.]|uniref:YfbK domain-containing protein n=1 Tax=Novipirellula sp. TaxID=2795430 RepID=UPI003567CF0B